MILRMKAILVWYRRNMNKKLNLNSNKLSLDVSENDSPCDGLVQGETWFFSRLLEKGINSRPRKKWVQRMDGL